MTVYSICSSLLSQTSLSLEELHPKWNKIYLLSKHHSGHNTPLQTPQHRVLHPPLQNSLTKAERQEASPFCTATCYFLKREKLDLFDLEHSRQIHVCKCLADTISTQTAYLSYFASGNWSWLMKFSSAFPKIPTHTSLAETAKRTKSHLWNRNSSKLRAND